MQFHQTLEAKRAAARKHKQERKAEKARLLQEAIARHPEVQKELEEEAQAEMDADMAD